MIVFRFLRLFILSSFDLSIYVYDQFCGLLGPCRYEILTGTDFYFGVSLVVCSVFVL